MLMSDIRRLTIARTWPHHRIIAALFHDVIYFSPNHRKTYLFPFALSHCLTDCNRMYLANCRIAIGNSHGSVFAAGSVTDIGEGDLASIRTVDSPWPSHITM